MRKFALILLALFLVCCTPAPTKFHMGDRVQMVGSGGPTMYVTKIWNGPDYSVEWFDRNGIMRDHTFEEAELQTAKAPQ